MLCFKLWTKEETKISELTDTNNRNFSQLSILTQTLKKEFDNYINKVLHYLCKIPDCPKDCDVCCNIPYNFKQGKFYVHHFFTERDPWLWNGDDSRFTNLSLDKNSLVVYVGANQMGDDGKILLDKFNCSIHLFEPVPNFFVNLSRRWKYYKRRFGFQATLHNFGLGENNRTVYLSQEDINQGQGTFGMEDSKGDRKIPLEIREGAPVIRNIIKDTTSNSVVPIDLFHVNCEGCEWEMIENLLATDLVKKMRTIQFGSHYFEEVPNILSRYCKIRSELKKTHKMVFGQSFGWERWDLR